MEELKRARFDDGHRLPAPIAGPFLVAGGKGFVLHLQARLEKREFTSTKSMTSFSILLERRSQTGCAMRVFSCLPGHLPCNVLIWFCFSADGAEWKRGGEVSAPRWKVACRRSSPSTCTFAAGRPRLEHCSRACLP